MNITATAKNQAAAIRLASEGDLPAINEIYNHYVLHSACTYQEEPELLSGRQQWFARHGERHPVIVAQIDARVVGWGSLSAYHPRSAYRNTVENSIYVHSDFHRRGIGSALLKDLIARARAIGHHAIIAGIDADQAASIGLHSKWGFKKVGHLEQVGFKFNKWLSVVYMELLLR